MGEAYITRRGGGNPLNFNVVGGTTEPANPKENTIWVNTDQKITSWHFGADEPNFYDIKSDESGYLLSAPHKLTEGEIINFIVPATITVGYEWICFVDGTGHQYSVRNGGGTQLSVWTAGTKISVKISNDLCTMGEYRVRTAYVFGFGNYYHEEGTVWISTGTSSPVAFNALKKNSIQVYPISAKQYISGAWVDKTAKSYQNGEWVEWWNGRLYVTGNEFEFVTGGWVDTPKGGGDSWDTPTTTFREIKKDNNGITVSESQARYATGAVSCRTAKKVSLRGYNTLKINVTAVNGDTHFKCFTNEPPWAQYNDHVAGITFDAPGVKTIDVSFVDSDVYIMFGVLSYSDASAHSASATFNEIWLE